MDSKIKSIAASIAREAVAAGLFGGALEGSPSEIALEYSLAGGDIDYARAALGADVSEAQSSAEDAGLMAVEDEVRCRLVEAALEIEEIAERHLAGIEGGLAGGASARNAAGLDADGWQVPDDLAAAGVGARELDAEVTRQLREAAQ